MQADALIGCTSDGLIDALRRFERARLQTRRESPTPSPAALAAVCTSAARSCVLHSPVAFLSILLLDSCVLRGILPFPVAEFHQHITKVWLFSPSSELVPTTGTGSQHEAMAFSSMSYGQSAHSKEELRIRLGSCFSYKRNGGSCGNGRSPGLKPPEL